MTPASSIRAFCNDAVLIPSPHQLSELDKLHERAYVSLHQQALLHRAHVELVGPLGTATCVTGVTAWLPRPRLCGYQYRPLGSLDPVLRTLFCVWAGGGGFPAGVGLALVTSSTRLSNQTALSAHRRPSHSYPSIHAPSPCCISARVTVTYKSGRVSRHDGLHTTSLDQCPSTESLGVSL